MKTFLLNLTSLLVIIVSLVACQRENKIKHFTLADSCFKNTLEPNPAIDFRLNHHKFGHQYPHVIKSLLDMPGANGFGDSTASLSRDKEIRITNWRKHKFGGKELKGYQDLVRYNAYVVRQKMFIPDTNATITQNIMFKNCKYPNFVMQGMSKEYFYFLKTELSQVPIVYTQALKNCLIRFPRKLKDKYWGTVHEMLEKTGFYQVDTVHIKKKLEGFGEKHKDLLKKEGVID